MTSFNMFVSLRVKCWLRIIIQSNQLHGMHIPVVTNTMMSTSFMTGWMLISTNNIIIVNSFLIMRDYSVTVVSNYAMDACELNIPLLRDPPWLLKWIIK